MAILGTFHRNCMYQRKENNFKFYFFNTFLLKMYKIAILLYNGYLFVVTLSCLHVTKNCM